MIIIIVELFQFSAWKIIVQAISRVLCVFHVDGMWTSTRRVVVSLRWTHVHRGWFFVDIINGWTLFK